LSTRCAKTSLSPPSLAANSRHRQCDGRSRTRRIGLCRHRRPSRSARSRRCGVGSQRGLTLFLIADHMPFGGRHGGPRVRVRIYMTNGFATDRTCNTDEFVFKRDRRNAGDASDSARKECGRAHRQCAHVHGPGVSR
jgi:hypothetical protein